MGANPVQAQAVVLFLVAFTLICVGLAGAATIISIVLGLIALAISIALFLKCKPWEQETR